MRLLRSAVLIAIVAPLALAAAGCSDDEPAPPAIEVVASTTLVGALAKAAGATDIVVIAPPTIPDQTGFEPTPDELAPAGRAKRVLYAESDGFAGALREAAGDAALVPVKPVTSLPEIRAEVTRLAGVLGTQSAATTWLSEFESQVNAMSTQLKGSAPIPALVTVAQADVAHWADFAGVKVAARYGPGPVSAEQKAALAAAKPEVVLANVHLPADTPDVPGTTRVDLMNYPGEELDLLELYVVNGDRIAGTFAVKSGS